MLKRQPAQAVVAAEFNDYDLGAKAQHGRKTGNSVFSGGSAGALVYDPVMVSARIQESAESIGIGLTGSQSASCCDAVAITDEDGRCSGKRTCGEKQE